MTPEQAREFYQYIVDTEAPVLKIFGWPDPAAIRGSNITGPVSAGERRAYWETVRLRLEELSVLVVHGLE